MTKILNLDELPVADERTIVFKGKRHSMRPMGVGQFLKKHKLSLEIDASGDAEKQVAGLLDLIHSVFPTTNREDLDELSKDQINAIFNMLMQSDEPPKEVAGKSGE